MRGTASKRKVPISWIVPADVIVVGWIGDDLYPMEHGKPETFASEVLGVEKDGHGSIILTMQEATTPPLVVTTKCTRVQ